MAKKQKKVKAGKRPAGAGPAPKSLRPPAPVKKKRKKPRKRQPKPAPRELDIISAIDEAYIEIEALGQEMRDWADSMEEKFSGTQKYDTVNTTADTLENIGNPVQSTGPSDESEYDFLKKVKITIQDPTPRARGFSRSARCGQATDLLEQVATTLETLEDEEGLTASEKEKAEELHREIDDHIGELQGCDFPGMYG